MNRIQAQRVEVIVLEPIQCVFDEESPHLVASYAVKVDGLTPGSLIAVRKVGSVSTKVVAFRPEMVVNHVERNRETVVVGRVYQALERLWSAVGVLGSEEIDAIIAPIAGPGKLRDRHQFNRRNSQGGELGKMGDDGIEGSFRGISSDVEFVKDGAIQRRAFPALIGPGEGIQVDDLRGTVHSSRLEAGGWIGQVSVTLALVEIFRAGVEGLDDGAMVSVCEWLHGKERTLPRPPASKVQAHSARLGSPQLKFPAAVWQPVGAHSCLFGLNFGG